jgi:hypothetical protein
MSGVSPAEAGLFPARASDEWCLSASSARDLAAVKEAAAISSRPRLLVGSPSRLVA